ncbi:ParA family protein [Streptomyces sp. NBC_00257]|uniref:ParA family protein n=1 Tax=Streptomyces TaxID=1883 RepID=UPI00225659B5|nr:MULTISPECIES: ParA family protein [unclassified Streptomyces]WSW10933.1 ParA family protein [Streptomyces sp. NBC_01005]WTB60813.1 ParA family protein [Streptomyces sp. NBC_00826]WTD00439.1 ParA family protein [Streptomyces sp. NBC_01650]WTH95954.1 ParA family protein [Streptomyces sp. NBC_00825]WTI05022.1 ParA family protein [Streptomyces sp. NBC_00822]
MTTPDTRGDREKVVSKLPSWLRQELKVRAVQHGIDMQDAVEAGITAWRGLGSNLSPIDTSGAESFATFLPSPLWTGFRSDCKRRGVSLIQGLAQSVRVWLDSHPAPAVKRPDIVRRVVICNQKGGVGKTAVTAGTGEALAEDSTALVPVRVSKHFAALLEEDEEAAGDPLALEDLPGLGQRVLLVDFDPQGHLTKQLGHAPLAMDGDSLTNHMAGDGKGSLSDLIVPIEEDRFGGRLHLLPACTDAFLLDVRLASVRARESALERALAAVEPDYDVILIDCPPSLGLSMDAATYYGRRRPQEAPGNSGVLIVVQAEDSSADAYELLTSQIEDMRNDLALDVDYLGLVVNHYDARRGYIATSSLQSWMAIKDPRVVGVIGDLKEQKEAVRAKRPLLAYAPRCEQSVALRALAREISK